MATLMKKNTNFLLNDNKLLLNKNLGCKFGLDGVNYGRISNIGTTSSFNFIHQTGVFRIEFEWYWDSTSFPSQQYAFANKGTNANNGILVYHNPTVPTRLYLIFGSGGSNIIASSLVCFSTSGLYKHVLVGDGTKVKIFTGKDGAYPTSCGTLPFTGVLVGTGNAVAALCIGGVTATNGFNNILRNFKIYKSTDTSNLTCFFPLQDSVNFNTCITGGLTGTVNNCGVQEF